MFDPMSIALMKKLGGGGGASSWNDLTDKPFDSEQLVRMLADSVSVAGAEDRDRSLGSFDLVIGEEYTVEFDGVQYDKLVCFDDGGFNAIGAPFGDYAKYPFCIYNDGYIICAYGGEGAHTVSVFQQTETVKTIDKKYLPEHLRFGSETSLVEVVSVQSFNFGDTVDDLHTVDIAPVEVTPGFSYVVLFDGIEYPVVAVEIGGGCAIGNLALARVGADTGEPFLFVPAEGALFSSLPGVHSFGFASETETIKPIDPKYIVLTSPNGTKYNLSVSDSGTLTATEAT